MLRDVLRFRELLEAFLCVPGAFVRGFLFLEASHFLCSRAQWLIERTVLPHCLHFIRPPSP